MLFEYVQGHQYMGLPLSSARDSPLGSSMGIAPSAMTVRGSSLQIAFSRAWQHLVRRRCSLYHFNMVVTERSRCSTSQWINDNGTYIIGPASDPDLPTVVLLHGYLGSSADWDLVAAGLAQTCRCISIDLPGHGDTAVDAAGAAHFTSCAGYNSSLIVVKSNNILDKYQSTGCKHCQLHLAQLPLLDMARGCVSCCPLSV